MKKIAFLVSSVATGGGIQKSLSLISNELKSEKYLITIISLFDYETTKYDFGDNTKIIKGTLKNNTDLKKNFVKTFLECNKLLKSTDYDTLIIESLGIVPFIAKNILNKDSLRIIVRDHAGLENYSKLGLSWIGLKRTMKYAEKFIVLTDENQKEYDDLFQHYNYKIKVIPNAIDPHVSKKKYNSESKKIIFVGRLSKEKGVDLLVKSFSKALQMSGDNEWKLDIFGSGPEEEHIRKLIIKNNMVERISLKGYKEKIYKNYHEYSFMVVPSRFESFGLAIVEALKVGIPVVSFDCNYGPRSIITDGKNGILVEPNNVEALSNAITNLMQNEELRKTFSLNTDMNLVRYSQENIINEWENIL